MSTFLSVCRRAYDPAGRRSFISAFQELHIDRRLRKQVVRKIRKLAELKGTAAAIRFVGEPAKVCGQNFHPLRIEKHPSTGMMALRKTTGATEIPMCLLFSSRSARNSRSVDV